MASVSAIEAVAIWLQPTTYRLANTYCRYLELTETHPKVGRKRADFGNEIPGLPGPTYFLIFKYHHYRWRVFILILLSLLAGERKTLFIFLYRWQQKLQKLHFLIVIAYITFGAVILPLENQLQGGSYKNILPLITLTILPDNTLLGRENRSYKISIYMGKLSGGAFYFLFYLWIICYCLWWLSR